MSNKREKSNCGQQFVDDLFRKITETGRTPNKDSVVNYPESVTTPNNTSSSGSSVKKRTPPTPPITDQLRNKKHHLDSEEETKQKLYSTESQKSGKEDMEPINFDTTNTDPKEPPSTFNFDGKLDGFPEEYKAFGRALCEIL